MGSNRSYKAAPNHNNEASFVDFSTTLLASKHIKPPKCPLGLQYPVHVHCQDGVVRAKGAPFAIWEWEKLEFDEYEAVLDAFGLSWDASDISAECTIAQLTDRNADTYTNYNGIVVHIKAQDAIFAGNMVQTARFLIKIVETT